MRASYFVTKAFGKGEREKVQKYKKDIRNMFGTRGNIICNLHTAGYFESFFPQLYNVVDEKEFNELYEIIVKESAITVFVHKEMTPKEIKDDIERKLNISKRYGINFIHIHGIGKENIFTIKQFIEKNELTAFKKKIFEDKEENIIVLKLILK